MKLVEKLMLIQGELKAPKSKNNSFGKYKYRSCEDILEAVKPLLLKYKCALTISDTITMIGNRIYVKADATLWDSESNNGERIENSAYARESEEKKGMDDSQITGTASSYARKYALNGLFCIDDTKDADTDEFQQTTRAAEEIETIGNGKISKTKAFALAQRCTTDGVSPEKVCALYKVEKLMDLTERQHENLNANWDKVVEKCKASAD